MAPNIPLLRRTLDHIRAHPEEWRQGYWRCGTTMCFAGHAAFLAGGEWFHPEDPMCSYMVAQPGEVTYLRGAVRVEDRARRVLGLTEGQADELFAGINTLGEIETLIDEICAEAGEAS